MNWDNYKNNLVQLADKIISKDDEVKIIAMNEEMTISQVVKFFERQGRSFTKTMIQNYIRVGVLPPPVDKRYYTKNHLVLLTLIDSIKSIYTLDEIKNILAPIMNNPEIFEDDLIKITDVYKNYLALRKEALSNWRDSLPHLADRINELLNEDNVPEDKKGIAMPFMIALTIMAETVAMHDLINELISNKN